MHRDPPRRPLLRGWTHLVATVPWAVAAIVLVALAAGHPARQATLALYGAASVWLFLVSGLYHVVTWSPRRRALMRRIDHGNIFLLVAATYTPISVAVLSRAWATALLVTVWSLTAAGIAVSVAPLRVPRAVLTGLYLLTGWVAVVALPAITATVGWGGLLMLLGAGALYSAGATMYALQRPTISARWFGYHELFHVCVLAANALFYTFMVVEVARR